MNYWWVNHKTSVKTETENGYIWSPQRTTDGRALPAYTNLTLVQPNDVIFSYAYGKIGAIGKIISFAQPAVQPKVTGKWKGNGWLVPVEWQKLNVPLVPKNVLEEIQPLLPKKNSPLKPNGNGNEIYLSQVSGELGSLLLGHIEQLNPLISEALNEAAWEIEKKINEDAEEAKISASGATITEREQLSLARIGQGKFKRALEDIETGCRLTQVTIKSMLVASHIKPWKDSTNYEKLDGNNGLLLAPHVDRLFDRGFISFTENGQILCSHSSVIKTMMQWSLNHLINVGDFNIQQQVYLEYHRQNVYLG